MNWYRSALGRTISSAALLIVAVVLFVLDNFVAGLVVLAFALVGWLATLYGKVHLAATKGQASPESLPYTSLAFKAGAFAAVALALAVLEFTGTWIHRDVTRGVLAMIGFLAALYLAVRIRLDSRRAARGRDSD
jgi:hypothetical protein